MQGLDQKNLMSLFDAVKMNHEETLGETFNDDHVYKQMLNLVICFHS